MKGGCRKSKPQDLPKFQSGGECSGKSKPQDLPKFQSVGGGVFWKVKTQSAKISLNFNLGGGGF